MADVTGWELIVWFVWLGFLMLVYAGGRAQGERSGYEAGYEAHRRLTMTSEDKT